MDRDEDVFAFTSSVGVGVENWNSIGIYGNKRLDSLPPGDFCVKDGTSVAYHLDAV